MSKNILIYPHLRHIHHRHRIFSSNVKAIIIHPHAANPTEKTRQRTARAQRARGGVEGVRPPRPGSHRQTLWEIIPLWLSLYFYASGGRWINVGRKQEEEHGESACSMSPGQREVVIKCGHRWWSPACVVTGWTEAWWLLVTMISLLSAKDEHNDYYGT